MDDGEKLMIPKGLVVGLMQAALDGAENMPDEITCKDLHDLMVKLLGYNPEPVVSAWYFGELGSIEDGDYGG